MNRPMLPWSHAPHPLITGERELPYNKTGLAAALLTCSIDQSKRRRER